jgi:hypothetical protein
MSDLSLSEVIVGKTYRSKANGQLLKVIAARVGAKGREVHVRALTSASGAGSARSPALGETRVVSNGHQWCKAVEPL